MEQVRRLFDEHAPGWPSKYSDSGPLVSRLSRFANALQALTTAPAAVLDLGCGSGELANHLSACGYNVVGTDASSAMIETARSFCGTHQIEWVLAESCSTLPFPNQRFDAVVASSMLEYVERPERTLAECARVLRERGVLLCSVPDTRHPIRRAEALGRLFADGLGSDFYRLCPKCVRRYLDYLRLSKNRLSLADWRALAGSVGLTDGGTSLDDTDVPSTLALLTFTKTQA